MGKICFYRQRTLQGDRNCFWIDFMLQISRWIIKSVILVQWCKKEIIFNYAAIKFPSGINGNEGPNSAFVKYTYSINIINHMFFHNPFCKEAFLQFFRKAERAHAVAITFGYKILSWSSSICPAIILSCNMCVLPVVVLKWVNLTTVKINCVALRVGVECLCSWFLSRYKWRHPCQIKESSAHLWVQNVHRRVHKIT
jgi:hypothetical protein